MATTPDDDAEIEDRARARLRQLRFERGLTVGGLASSAGLAASTVSRLETGARRLTLRHVAVLARALGIDPDELLVRDRGGTADGAAPQTRDGKTWRPVAPERADGPRAYRVTIPASLREPELRSHEGHATILVLSGRLRIVVAGGELLVAAGETIEFSTWRPHWIGAVDGPVELLMTFSPDGAPPTRRVLPGDDGRRAGAAGPRR